MRKKSTLLILLILIAAMVVNVAAEEPAIGLDNVETIANSPIPSRDPVDLSVRLMGYDPNTFDIETRPTYQVGDVETFVQAGSEGVETQDVEFVLAAAGDDVYIWVEQGMDYDPANAQLIADTIQEQIIPTVRTLFGEETDIDNDPHVYTFTVFNAGPGIAGYYNDTDFYPNEIFPSSNEVNSLIMALSIDDPAYYLSTWAHEFQHLVQAGRDDSEATWYVEGVAELGSLLAYPRGFSTGFQSFYLSTSTENQLNFWPMGDTIPYYGASSLFLSYITQQYGEEWLYYIANEPNDDVIGLELALENYGALDPLTGEPVTFNDVFADWIIANYLNDPNVEDGRFDHNLMDFSSNLVPATQSFDSPPVAIPARQVNQYGTLYYEINPNGAQTFNIVFDGEKSVQIVPTEAHSGEYFYWSQRGNQGDARLTGRFDLTDVTSATFNFSTWYEIEDVWDFGYISVSADNGETWQVMTTPEMTSENPYDRAFATGYSERSGGGDTAEWIEQSIDLTPFAGSEILVRFDYVTDQATDLEGWILDDVSIPEIGFSDDFEQSNDAWTAEGWGRISNVVPQEYLLQAIVYGEETTVTRLIEPGQPIPSSISLDVAGAEKVVLTVSGIAPVTRQPAPFSLSVTTE